MTDIRFYHLTRSALEQALPPLLEKIYNTGRRALLWVGSSERADSLNQHLWTYRDDSFLPHALASEKDAAANPVLITLDGQNKNNADVLLLTDGVWEEKITDYQLVCVLFDGTDEQMVKSARDYWKIWQGLGHSLTYWQQSERGWEQKGQ